MATTFDHRSENARHMILSCTGKIYHVSRVHVRLSKDKERHQATFHAKEAGRTTVQDLDIEIPHKVYEVLVAYTEIDSPDLILILRVIGHHFKWSFVSQNHFNHCTTDCETGRYIV